MINNLVKYTEKDYYYYKYYLFLSYEVILFIEFQDKVDKYYGHLHKIIIKSLLL